MKKANVTQVVRPAIVAWALWILLLPTGCMNLETSVMYGTIETDETVGLENSHMRLEFSRETGSLISLKNVATGDEYLKDPGGDGNPFRAYVDTTEMPPILRINFPFPVQPVEGAMGGRLVDPKDCTLVEHSFRRENDATVLQLVSHDDPTGLTFDLDVTLPDDDIAVTLALTVRNDGPDVRHVMTASPYLTGMALGPNRDTNLATRLYGFGQSRAPAWMNCGGIYGRKWGAQCNAVYEPTMNEGLGVITKDAKILGKVVRRFEGGGLSMFYFNNHELAVGQSFTYPPAEIVVHTGDWKVTIKRYGEWFRETFKPRKHAKWLDDVDSYRGWPWIPKPTDVAKAKEHPDQPGVITSFAQLDRMYLDNQYDLKEWAMFWQGIVRTGRYWGYHHSDGLYDVRQDLGGPEAFQEGSVRVERLGRVVGLYVAMQTCRYDSPFLKKYPNMKPEDWLLMPTPDTKPPNALSFYMCPRYLVWQDHLAATCARLVKETGAKYIRIDEFGHTFLTCYNPAHHHNDPIDGHTEMLELLRKIREAVDEVDPDVALFTETATDLVSIHFDGTLAMWATVPDIAPMRLIIPEFVGLCYSIGQIEGALQGFIPGPSRSLNGGGWWLEGWEVDFHPGLELRPAFYPKDEDIDKAPQIRWNELGHSFVEAVRRGTPHDVNPVALGVDTEEWVARLWMSEDYWLITGGSRIARRPEKPVRFKLPELPDDVEHAIEFDAETLAMRETELERTKDGIYVTVHNGFSAVLLPRPACPPVVQVSEPPAEKPDGAIEMELSAFAPWRKSQEPVRVQVDVVGITDRPVEVTLPARVSVSVPGDVQPGWYKVLVTGDCLRVKRWVERTVCDHPRPPLVDSIPSE